VNKNINLQDVFLNQARKEQVMVKLILMNGYQFKGVVKGFDSYVVILDCEGKQNVVYKHAISTVVPDRSINIMDAANNNNNHAEN
jgi:RNA-binding protein Hfq